MDSTTVAIIGSLGGVVAAAAGWFSKQGVDAWLKIRADRRVDLQLNNDREDKEDEKQDNSLRYIIGIQQGELTSLRTEIKEKDANFREELKAIHDKHNDCEKRQAELSTELRVRMEFMNNRMEKVEQHVDPKLIVEMHDTEAVKEAVVETKSAIRQAVHDLRDDINAVKLKAHVEAEQQAREEPPK